MRVLVTGGRGFIGCNLTEALVDRGHDVVVLDDDSNPSGRAEIANVQYLNIDVADAPSVASAVRGVDAVVHLAARGSVPRSVADPVGAFRANAAGTLAALEAARESDASLVVASSSSVYGRNTSTPKTERMWMSPMSPYAASKLASEAFVSSYVESYSLKALSLRFFNVFGPWQRPDHVYAAVIPRWIWRAMHDSPLIVEGDGLQSRDFTSVNTVVEVLVAAVEKQLSDPVPVNLAFGNNISLLEVIDHLQSIMGRELRVEFAAPRQSDVRISQNDPALLESLFPDIHPEPFDRALNATYDWLATRESVYPAPQPGS